MHLLRTAWLLTIVALCSAGVAFAQHGARTRVHREAEAGEAGPVGGGGLFDLAPSRGNGSLAVGERAARVRRRWRPEQVASPAQVVESGAVPWCELVRAARSDGGARPGAPQVLDDRGRSAWQRPIAAAAAAMAAERLAWREAAKRALARPAHGVEPEPPVCVVKFGIDGPRLVPLTLFD